MPTKSEYFVYLYRDAGGNPVYVGQGKSPNRAISTSRGKTFKGWLEANRGKFKLEVIGPLHTRALADAVESSIISACLPATALNMFNIHPGRSQYQFRPFGVPTKYADRTAIELGEKELKQLAKKLGNLLFVRINQTHFTDGPGRLGYDLANPPNNDQIRARIEAWWQLNNRLEAWSSSPSNSPAVLIGVTGGPKTQSVIASAAIAGNKWTQVEHGKRGLIKVPLKNKSLDHGDIRGCRIAPEVGLKFSRFERDLFRIYTPQGFQS